MGKIKQYFCRHEFNYNDYTLTNIPLPNVSDYDTLYDTLVEYMKSSFDYNHPSHAKRIVAVCDKCDKIFFTHCGLDLRKFGKMTFKKLYEEKNKKLNKFIQRVHGTQI